MPSCLGIYIENNLIKYAKLTKDRDIVKLDAFGLKFYDKIDDAIEQIVNETFSYKVPISINLIDENYNYFEMFTMLSEKDMSKAIDTEFEILCEEKGYNKNSIDTRYLLVNILENREKTKAMHVSCQKSEIVKRIAQFQKYNLKSIVPLPVSISNNIEIGVKENAAIINLEKEATITTILNGQINKVDILDHGMKEIYEKINTKENSYAKVYDVLKNTTIYTLEGKGLQEEENQYLEDIMPTLYNILQKTKEVLENNLTTIEKLYITGTGAVINNIDLYFQEFLMNTKCEILKPYFLKNVSVNRENIKDYIEVNSAIALALHEIDKGNKTVNFRSTNGLEKLKEILNQDVSLKKAKDKSGSKNSSGSKKFSLDMNLSGALDAAEVSLIRFSGAIVFAIILFCIVSAIISNLIDSKREEADDLISYTNAQITSVSMDMQRISEKTSDYSTLITNLEQINQKVADEASSRFIIPDLLYKIMTVMPKNAQITSIQNTSSRHIVINAQAKEYPQLSYLLAAIKTDGILVNVKSNSGIKENNIVRITIEGDMP